MAATTSVFEEYELDPGRFELRRAGEVVPMEPQVFEVLAYLVANRDRIVLKDEIIGHVWPEGFISDSALNTRVMAARKAVGDTGKEQRLIRTIRGRGFRFVGKVEQRAAADSLLPPASHETAGAPVAASADMASRGVLGLDVAATTFVGRETELARLMEMLERPGCRLITITGPGGIGKTRLAAALADRLRAAGQDVAAVSLQSLRSDEELRVAIAGSLGLTVAGTEASMIADRIGPRAAVLVLDNFEQLVGAGATTLATLVVRTQALRIVITSREVLGLREEWLLPIGGLSWDDGEAADAGAVQLFLDREAQAGADAEAPGEGIEAIREVCRLVDGMPLGVELAASLRRYMTRAQIAERISRDIGVLSTELRNLPARHRAIPGLLEETCGHLTGDQLSALLSLSVFEGSFTLDAATRVAGAALGTVGELVDRSLVQARTGRYALHPLMRQHARQRLDAGFEKLEMAHAEFFAAFLSERREALEGGRQATASTEIDEDLPNILSAWRWACDHERVDLIEQAAYPLYLYAHLRSRWAELRPAFDIAAAAAEGAGDAGWPALGALRVFQTWSLIRTAPGPEVVTAHRRAEDLFSAHGELPPPGFATDTVAIRALILWSGGRYLGMLRRAEEARERAEARGDVLGEAYALWLGAAAHDRIAVLRWDAVAGRIGVYNPATPEDAAHLHAARSALDRAAGLLSAREERGLRSSILYEQAWNAKALGDTARSAQLTREVYALRSEFGDLRGMAEALIELVGSYGDAADAEPGESCLRQADAIATRLGDPIITSELLRARALHGWLRRDYDAALSRAAEAAELSLRIGSVNNVLGTLRLVGHVMEETGDIAAAAEVHVFVAGHPASPPFSRARAQAALHHAAAALSEAEVQRIRERIGSAQLAEFTASVLARIAPAGVQPSASLRFGGAGGPGRRYQTPPKRLPEV